MSVDNNALIKWWGEGMELVLENKCPPGRFAGVLLLSPIVLAILTSNKKDRIDRNHPAPPPQNHDCAGVDPVTSEKECF